MLLELDVGAKPPNVCQAIFGPLILSAPNTLSQRSLPKIACSQCLTAHSLKDTVRASGFRLTSADHPSVRFCETRKSCKANTACLFFTPGRGLPATLPCSRDFGMPVEEQGGRLENSLQPAASMMGDHGALFSTGSAFNFTALSGDCQALFAPSGCDHTGCMETPLQQSPFRLVKALMLGSFSSQKATATSRSCCCGTG